MIRHRLLSALAAIVVAGTSGCSALRTDASTSSLTPPPSAPSSTAFSPIASEACTRLSGTTGSDGMCHVSSETSTYTMKFGFPIDYPDMQPVTDYIAARRDEFIDWLAKYPVPNGVTSELDINGKSYKTADTRSLVLTIGTQGGVHPVTTFKSFNYDVDRKAPITFDTLFRPDARPLSVLNPAVQRKLDERHANDVSAADTGVDAYQNFAITDDALIFFINQDGAFPHYVGSLEVPVPRTELAPLLVGSGAVSPCADGQVTVTAEQPQAAATHRAVTLAFSLAPGAGSCTLAGYPGVDTGAGGPLVHADRLPRGYMGGLPAGVDQPPTVTLTPSMSAHAVVEGIAVDKTSAQCPTYTELRVTPPDTTETSTVETTIDTCVLIVHPVT